MTLSNPSGPPRLFFIEDDEGKPIGKEDQYGNIYTLNGRPSSYVRYNNLGHAVENKSHTLRVMFSKVGNTPKANDDD